MTHDDGKPRQAFDPDMVAAINRAYEGAVAALGVTTAHSDRRAVIAKHIMDLAKAGETDEIKLREAAVAHLMSADRPGTYTGL